MNALHHIINSELSNISLWMKISKLSLTISKTHCMIFSRRKCCSVGIQINIDGSGIEEIQSTEFLRVINDKWLNLKSNISCIYRKKLSRGIGMKMKANAFSKHISLAYIALLFRISICMYDVLQPCLVHCIRKPFHKVIIILRRILRIIMNSSPPSAAYMRQ